jgi:oxygen-independent coproporphyrinogen-3 oxidase
VFGIYLHIPFCRKACVYCDFHFSTSFESRGAVLDAMCKEIAVRQPMTATWGTPRTLYFGGGTPSLLTPDELGRLFDAIERAFPDAVWEEVTLEANPEDITPQLLSAWKSLGIDRLSIGIQTFDDRLLTWMNRAHTGAQAEEAVRLAHSAGFERISIDLIYGLPGCTPEAQSRAIDRALALPVTHLSAYALTVEPRTALGHRVAQGSERPAPDESVERAYLDLCRRVAAAGGAHYEVSNFALAGGEPAVHNRSYWAGLPYLGIGPGAHGFTTTRRYANVAHNLRYAQAVARGEGFETAEVLTLQDRYNEHIMTGLRTAQGLSPDALESAFGLRPDRDEPLAWTRALQTGELVPADAPGFWRIPEASWMVGDTIAARFFHVD